ncbi:hypothetical protein [Mycobacteroides sp. PCS013]|uniref:hypothetical protein n=1 Tax=Mycobacteroides sp. PCS013 TaxID=3074106 RepID=UPI003C2C76CA
MSLIEWALSKLKPELLLPALWRMVASLIGIATLGCAVLQKSIYPYPSTPTGLLASIANRAHLAPAERWLTQVGQWLNQQPQNQLAWLVGVIALCSGLYWAARYRVNAVENLHVSLTWIGLGVLRETGCAAWAMLLIAVAIALVVAQVHVSRFGSRYHRLRDRLNYILAHAVGSLADLPWIVGFLLIRGTAALGAQWFVINPRAEFWYRVDRQRDDDDVVEVQPREGVFAMFAPPGDIEHRLKRSRMWSHADTWRLLKRSPEVEWGGGGGADRQEKKDQ